MIYRHELFVVSSCRQVNRKEIQLMKEQRVMKSYEELKYSDDFMFRKVMGDKVLCREVIECLLQKPVGE